MGQQDEQRSDRLLMPYLAHESDMARMERTIRRLWILCIILIVILFGSNVAWVVYENQYIDEEITTIEAKQDGAETNIVGGGDITNVTNGENNED